MPRFLRLWSLWITLRNKLSNNQILLQESLFPALQVLQLLVIETLEIVEGTLEILGEHLFIEALACETASSVAAGKVLVCSAL